MIRRIHIIAAADKGTTNNRPAAVIESNRLILFAVCNSLYVYPLTSFNQIANRYYREIIVMYSINLL